jgi:hypothetical protein
MLGGLEPDAMLGPIDPVFRDVPFEIGHQSRTISQYVYDTISLYG